MNEELKALVLKAGAPVEVMDQMWFNLFCQQFADILFTEVEGEYNNVAKEGDYGIAK
jgi:hypothetical protein